jgi:quercetin dioxygenase-like cupin family protein
VADVLGPGEGHARFEARGSVMLFKALAELDDGDLSLMERTLPAGGRRPPAHRHMNCSEAYFVLDGQVLVTVADQDLAVGPEGFVLVPRGIAHTLATCPASPPGCWSSTPLRWMPTSPRCMTCGTGMSRPPRRKNGS